MGLDISNPVQFVAFIVAAVLAGLTLAHQLFSRLSIFGLKPKTMAPIFIGVLFAVGAILSAYHNKTGESLKWLFGSEAIDRGPFEWGTAICLIIAGIFCIRLARVTQSFQRMLFALLAVACLFVAGEEMSWGQWIFRWDTPEALSQINLQDETNLHNLVNPRIYDFIYYMIGYSTLVLSMFAYFGFKDKPGSIPAPQASLAQLMTSAGNWLRDSRIGLVVAMSAAALFTHELFEEYAEFILALGLMLFILHHHKNAARPSTVG